MARNEENYICIFMLNQSLLALLQILHGKRTENKSKAKVLESRNANVVSLLCIFHANYWPPGLSCDIHIIFTSLVSHLDLQREQPTTWRVFSRTGS